MRFLLIIEPIYSGNCVPILKNQREYLIFNFLCIVTMVVDLLEVYK